MKNDSPPLRVIDRAASALARESWAESGSEAVAAYRRGRKAAEDALAQIPLPGVEGRS